MISVTELRNGSKVEMDGGLWECLDYSHLKMGRGGGPRWSPSFAIWKRAPFVERTFNASEKLKDIFIDYRTMQYLYNDGSMYTFMDTETYEQPNLSREQIGDGAKYLKESMEVTVDYFAGRPLKVTLPNIVELTITQTDPGVKGGHGFGWLEERGGGNGRVGQRALIYRAGGEDSGGHAHG